MKLNHKFMNHVGVLPFLFFWLLISLHSCKNEESRIAFFDGQADTLSLGSTKSFVMLDSCVVGLGDRSLISLKERDGLYYLLDIQSKRLFSLDGKGNTRYIIDRVGRGPGEYLGILDFDVSKDGSVYLLTGEGDEVMLFSEGEFIRKFQIGFRASSIAFMSDGIVAFFKQRYEDDNLGRNVIIITDSQFNVKNSFLEESSTILTGSEHLASGSCNSMLCCQQYDNNLYRFDGDGLISRLTIDFGEKVFPESIFAVEDFRIMLSMLPEVSACYISSCFENEHYILLNVTLFDKMDESNRFICLYKKSNQKTFVKKVAYGSNEYEIKGLPVQITRDDRVVFLYEVDKASSRYALLFQSIL